VPEPATLVHPTPRARVRAMKEYHPPLGSRDGLRLDFNENTFACSPAVRDVLGRISGGDLTRYPERESVEAIVDTDPSADEREDREDDEWGDHDCRGLMRVTVGLAVFATTDQGIDWSIVTAATLMTSMPLVVAFLLFQRQFVQSFMRAGIR